MAVATARPLTGNILESRPTHCEYVTQRDVYMFCCRVHIMIERLARDVQEWFRSISIVDAADDGRVVSCSGNFRVPRGDKIEKDDNTRLSRAWSD